MPRKKRTLADLKDDSDFEEDISNQPPRKKSRRISNSKQKKLKKKEEEKNMFDLDIFEFETIAIIAPQDINSISGSIKIASFDMDHTLVSPKGKNKFPKGRKDWKWMYGNNIVVNKLRELHFNGYQIVIFTNQNGIGSGKQSLRDVGGKIIDLAEALQIPLIAFMSKDKDYWRKPNITMWKYFENNYNNSLDIDYKLSFYCGDAAGRPNKWRNKDTKKDFSCSDRKFAFNIGIDFHTPEAYFLGENENKTWKWLSLNPNKWIKIDKNKENRINNKKNWFHGNLPIAQNNDNKINKINKKLEMVLMMGPPGCGKSTFAKTYLVSQGYVWINRDTLKTKKKCMDAAKKALLNGKCCVIDNTNPNYSSREVYIKIANDNNANIRLFRMNTERQLAEHLNLVRERSTKGGIKRISRIVYNIYYKKLRESGEPDLNEGYKEIVNIDWIPQFKNNKQKKEFLLFT